MDTPNINETILNLIAEILNGKKYGYEIPVGKCLHGDVFLKLDDGLYFCANGKWAVVLF